MTKFSSSLSSSCLMKTTGRLTTQANNRNEAIPFSISRKRKGKVVSMFSLVLIFVVLFVTNSNALTLKTWTGGSSGLWTTTTNWSPASLPASTDSIVISTTTSITAVPTVTIGSIYINTSFVTLTPATTNTLSIAATGTYKITSGDSLKLASNLTLLYFPRWKCFIS